MGMSVTFCQRKLRLCCLLRERRIIVSEDRPALIPGEVMKMFVVKTMLGISCAMIVIASLIFAQTPNGAKPSFEVATIKPSDTGNNFIGIGRAPGGRFT